MKLAQKIKEYTAQAEVLSFRDAYSGRGMFGAACIGVVGTSQQLQDMLSELIREMMSEVHEAALEKREAEKVYETAQDAVAILMGYHSDSMGHDLIYYWPYLTKEDLDEGDDDSEEYLDE